MSLNIFRAAMSTTLKIIHLPAAEILNQRYADNRLYLPVRHILATNMWSKLSDLHMLEVMIEPNTEKFFIFPSFCW